MISENIALRKAVDILRNRLPPGWEATQVESVTNGADQGVDGLVRVTAPDGRKARLAFTVKLRIDPRRAQAYTELANQSGQEPTLVIAPWVSDATRAVLVEGGLNVVDLSGGVYLSLSDPGLFVETASAPRNPWPEPSRVTLRGATAARVVRALCTARPPIGIRALAARAGTTPGYVSKLIRVLDQQGALQRTERGQIADVHLRRLLQQWGDDAPLETRTATTSWIAPRGLSAMLDQLSELELLYAITGTLAASQRAPITAPRLVSIYVQDPDEFAASVGIRTADMGANVLLLTPETNDVFENTWTEQDLRFASLPQVVADLLSGPGRGPTEADALLSWMIEHQEVWRG